MERNDIISIAFIRPINSDLITDGDITRATRTYVERYVTDSDAAFLAMTAAKEVIAYGVAYDLIDRMDYSIEDRGIFKVSVTGAASPSELEKQKLRGAMYRRLINAMEYMLDVAEDEGYKIDNENEIGLNVVSSKTRSTTL